MKKAMLTAVIGLLMVSGSWGARPLTTDDAGTLGSGAWEIEEGYELAQPKGGGNNSGSLGTALKYGLLPNFDLGIEAPYSVSSPNGMGDATVKGKLSFNEAAALGINVKLTNADAASGLGSGYMDCGINGILSHGIGSVTLHLNLGYTIVGQAGGSNSENNIFSYAAAIEHPFNDRINLMAEIFGSSTPSLTTNPLDLLFGLNWALNDVFVLDGGLDLGLTDASSQYTAKTGVTVGL